MDHSTGDRSGSPMLDGIDFAARLDAAEERLRALADGPVPRGLTEPDPGGTERWNAAQVWAHVAEFVPYWRGELESIIAAYDGEPVPFGRTKTDPARIEAIEIHRADPIPVLWARVCAGLDALGAFLGGLTPAEWNAVGLHPRRGQMDVEAIVEEFEIQHLEEHAEQLERLR
jgi:hypothetical protein